MSCVVNDLTAQLIFLDAAGFCLPFAPAESMSNKPGLKYSKFDGNEPHSSGYSVWPDGPITGTPKRVPEPATISLLFLGVAAIGH